MDDLHFEYPEELQRRLALTAPATDLALRIYKQVADIWEQQFETDDYDVLVDRIRTYPNIPDEMLTPEYVLSTWIPRLSYLNWQEPIAKNTVLTNLKKPEGKIRDQLGLIIARCVPLFLLEATSSAPRIRLFEIRKMENEERVYGIMKLPDDAIYTKDL